MNYGILEWPRIALEVVSQGQMAVPAQKSKHQSDGRARQELYGVSISGPRNSYLTRNHFSLSLALAELRACIAGVDVSEFLTPDQLTKVGAYFEPAYANYGPRLAHQIPLVCAALRESPLSRQAVMYTNIRPRVEQQSLQSQPACVQSIQFLWAPDNRLHAVASLRSSDLYRGFPYDWFLVTHLAAYVAYQVGATHLGGTCTFQIGNAHLYLADLKALAEDVGSYELVNLGPPGTLAYLSEGT